MEFKRQSIWDYIFDISQVKKEEKNGRFFLYPKTNTFNLILLDHIDSRSSLVKWNFDAEKKNGRKDILNNLIK